MLKTIKSAVTRYLREARSSTRPDHAPRARLHLESMEVRLVASTSPVASVAPVAAATVTPTPVAADNQGGIIPISPDRPVHGYKWRPRPWDTAPQPTPTIAPIHVDLGVIPPS